MNQPTPQRPADHWWHRGTQIATIAAALVAVVTLLVAYFAWRNPVQNGAPAGSERASATSPATSASGVTAPATSASPARPVTELQVRAGAANVSVDGGTMVVPCGTGNTGDTRREIEYWLRGAYRSFTAEVEVTEVTAPEIRTQLEVFTDSELSANVILTGAQSRPVSAEVDGGDVLRLRLTCQQRDTVVVIRDAAVHG